MATMTTNLREIDIDQLVLTAYQYAGLMNELQTAEGAHWDARSAYGRRHLEVIVDRLGADGIYERSTEFYSVPFDAGAQSAVMPADTIDIVGDGMLRVDSATETEVCQISRDTYFAIADKSSPGTPSKCFLMRGSPMLLYVWPVPEGACTVRVQRQKLTYDNSRGSATVDLERFWMDYLLNELAARLAISTQGPATVAALQAKAMEAKRAAQAKASSQVGIQMELDHPSAYSRGGFW